jgi:hypothetical protein
MRKIITILIMLVVTAITASAVTYQVKYVNEYGNTEKVCYSVIENFDKDITNYNISGIRKSYHYEEIIDEDSDKDDIAIVNKLDRQGYAHAMRNCWDTQYLKINDQWHKFYKHK